jgi:hypothetical protein
MLSRGRFRLQHCLEEILHNLGLTLLASLLNGLDLLIGLLVRLVLGLLVALAMLHAEF